MTCLTRLGQRFNNWNLNIMAREFRLQDYHDSNIVKFLRYGWPINYTADKLPESSSSNHPSALSYSEHVDYYIATELELGAITGPFIHNPLPRPLICSPLQTVPKRGYNVEILGTRCRLKRSKLAFILSPKKSCELLLYKNSDKNRTKENYRIFFIYFYCTVTM